MFKKDISNLRVSGGGDCGEMAFKGMEDALNEDPEYGGTMFVFTDAAPKDGTESKWKNVADIAKNLEMKINFFLDEKPCGSEAEIERFRKLADSTGGNY